MEVSGYMRCETTDMGRRGGTSVPNNKQSSWMGTAADKESMRIERC